MARFKFGAPLATQLVLLKPSYSEVYGVPTATYPDMEHGEIFMGSFRTFGGSEREVNGQYSIEKTATIETWFREDIKPDCRIGVPQTGEVYQIMGAPENIELRNQYMQIRVIAIEGGAGL